MPRQKNQLFKGNFFHQIRLCKNAIFSRVVGKSRPGAFFKVFVTGFSVVKEDLASGFSVFRQDLASGFSVVRKVLAFCGGKKIEFLKATFSIKSAYVKMIYQRQDRLHFAVFSLVGLHARI